MMHYRKGENVEGEIKKEDLPFEDCFPNGLKDFLWMQVKGGTKVNNVVSFAENALKKGDYRTIVWTGAGGGLVKTVSCVEILKRTHPLFQVTRMCYKNIEEHWLPQMEGLDEIIVNRKIPCLHILVSLDEIDDSINGLQKPNTQTNFFGDASNFKPSNRQGGRNQGRSGGSQQPSQNRNQYGGKNGKRPTKYQQHQRETKDNRGQESQQKNVPQGNAQKRRHDIKNQKTHFTEKTLETKSSTENSASSTQANVTNPVP